MTKRHPMATDDAPNAYAPWTTGREIVCAHSALDGAEVDRNDERGRPLPIDQRIIRLVENHAIEDADAEEWRRQVIEAINSVGIYDNGPEGYQNPLILVQSLVSIYKDYPGLVNGTLPPPPDGPPTLYYLQGLKEGRPDREKLTRWKELAEAAEAENGALRSIVGEIALALSGEDNPEWGPEARAVAELVTVAQLDSESRAAVDNPTGGPGEWDSWVALGHARKAAMPHLTNDLAARLVEDVAALPRDWWCLACDSTFPHAGIPTKCPECGDEDALAFTEANGTPTPEQAAKYGPGVPNDIVGLALRMTEDALAKINSPWPHGGCQNCERAPALWRGGWCAGCYDKAPKDGGCSRCEHPSSAHGRQRCFMPHCDCTGFRVHGPKAEPVHDYPLPRAEVLRDEGADYVEVAIPGREEERGAPFVRIYLDRPGSAGEVAQALNDLLAAPRPPDWGRRSCPSHCCPTHGCKYSHDDCPVVALTMAPRFPNNNGCEACEDAAADTIPHADLLDSSREPGRAPNAPRCSCGHVVTAHEVTVGHTATAAGRRTATYGRCGVEGCGCTKCAFGGFPWPTCRKQTGVGEFNIPEYCGEPVIAREVPRCHDHATPCRRDPLPSALFEGQTDHGGPNCSEPSVNGDCGQHDVADPNPKPCGVCGEPPVAGGCGKLFCPTAGTTPKDWP